MKITYYGHACFGFELDGTTFVIDPFISPNELASHININNVQADFMLITHGHADHVADAEVIAKNTDCMVIAPFEVCNWMGEKGIEKLSHMNHGGRIQAGNCTVFMVNAVHSSSFPDGSYAGNPCGYVIESESSTIYFAGDTALTMDMQLLPKCFTRIDHCVLPIGDVFTMGVQDAIMASEFVQCNSVIGCHYDTFPPIKIDKESAQARFAEKGKTLMLLDIGNEKELTN